MPSPAARIRADLQARTGVDFAEYADDEFVDAISGWSGLLGLARDLALAVGAGLAVIVLFVTVTVVSDLEDPQPTGVVIGGIVAAAGVAVLVFALLVRRRIPSEVSRVFDVSERLGRRVADDLASGRLNVTVSEAARGVVMVAAIPALVRASRRRFPLVGTVVGPVVGTLLGRAIPRLWPAGSRSASISGLEGPARRLDAALESARRAVLPRLATGVRWATLPLLLAGFVLAFIGLAVVGLTLVA